MAFVDFVCIVELAVGVCLSVIVVPCRMIVEVAHAELRTTAGFNRGGVDCPILGRTVAYRKREQAGNGKKYDFAHTSTPFWWELSAQNQSLATVCSTGRASGRRVGCSVILLVRKDVFVFQNNLLAGKRILVTGGATGLGKSMGKRFLELGAKLYICGRREDVLKEAANELQQATGGTGKTVSRDVRDR